MTPKELFARFDARKLPIAYHRCRSSILSVHDREAYVVLVMTLIVAALAGLPPYKTNP